MTIGAFKEMVKAVLLPVGLPVGYLVNTSGRDTYFTWFILTDRNAAWGDGEPLVREVHIQLDGWSKGDMDMANAQAHTLLISAGFRYELGRELYEEDTKTFHRVQQFYYCKEEL